MLNPSTTEEVRQVLGSVTFPFAFTECMFAFPEELQVKENFREKLVYAQVVKYFDEKCFSNLAWIVDPKEEILISFSVPKGADVDLVWRLIDRLFNVVSATLYRQAMPDGTWMLGAVRSLSKARAA